MARLPSFISRVQGKRGVTFEARINHGPADARVQLRKRFRTADEAKSWHSAAMA